MAPLGTALQVIHCVPCGVMSGSPLTGLSPIGLCQYHGLTKGYHVRYYWNGMYQLPGVGQTSQYLPVISQYSRASDIHTTQQTPVLFRTTIFVKYKSNFVHNIYVLSLQINAVTLEKYTQGLNSETGEHS